MVRDPGEKSTLGSSRLSSVQLGRPKSAEHRANMSKAMRRFYNTDRGREIQSQRAKAAWEDGKLARTQSPEHVQRRAAARRAAWERSGTESMQGANNPNWKGGITPEHQKIRGSDEYQYWRRKVLERDGYKCLKCGEKETRLVAHHIKSFKSFPDFRLDVDNGATLCDSCHTTLHNLSGNGDCSPEQYEIFMLGSLWDF